MIFAPRSRQGYIDYLESTKRENIDRRLAVWLGRGALASMVAAEGLEAKWPGARTALGAASMVLGGAAALAAAKRTASLNSGMKPAVDAHDTLKKARPLLAKERVASAISRLERATGIPREKSMSSRDALIHDALAGNVSPVIRNGVPKPLDIPERPDRPRPPVTVIEIHEPPAPIGSDAAYL